MKTRSSFNMDKLVTLIGPLLYEAGFRRRGRAFNHRLDNGLTQVVSFYMGPIWSNTYGSFEVELGVYVPEVRETLGELYGWKALPEGNFVPISMTTITTRLSSLAELYNKDFPWDLQSDVLQNSSAIIELLDARGFPWLQRYTTREEICLNLKEDRKFMAIWWSREAEYRVIAAIILAKKGDAQTAKRLLQEECQESATHSPRRELPEEIAQAYLANIRRLAVKLGISLDS